LEEKKDSTTKEKSEVILVKEISEFTTPPILKKVFKKKNLPKGVPLSSVYGNMV
jgi:hypothetical protein